MWRTPLLTTGLVAAIFSVLGCRSDPSGPNSPLDRLERALVFPASHFPEGTWGPGPGVEEVWFESAPEVRLCGWYAPAPQPRAVVLFCHGNGGNITDLRPVVRLFRDQLATSVLVFDYRGYGRSSGSPSEAGLYEDARAARRWLAARTGVDERDVVLVGHSIGGGVAVELAAADGARGLVLQNTFTSLPDAAQSHVPVRALMKMRFDSLSHIGCYHGPLLQTHGDADRVIPFALGVKLFEAANEPKQFVRVPGGGHNDLPSGPYQRALDRFFDELPPAPPPDRR